MTKEVLFTRRDFLKITTAEATSGAAGFLLGNETEKINRGFIRTCWGNFYPIYERHDMRKAAFEGRVEEIIDKTRLNGLVLEASLSPLNIDPQLFLYATFGGGYSPIVSAGKNTLE